MSQIEGFWYPQGSSARFAAELLLQNSSYHLAPEFHSDISGGFVQLKISDRIGNIPRKIAFPDGSIFETRDNDSIDDFLTSNDRPGGLSRFIYRLESQWRWALVALLVTLAVSFATFSWGIPWTARQIAHALPTQANELISSGTLETLDRVLLSESALSEARKKQLSWRFDQLTPLGLGDYAFKLHFRGMMDVPNAFALPSGDIVITDALVELAEHDEEIDSVLLHEIGHVVHRHGLQQIIRVSIIGFAIAMISGDATDMNQLLVAFPAFLLQQKYSRDHETEADTYAFKRMKTLGMDPEHFATMMTRLMESLGEEGAAQEGDKKHLSEYLATHPATQQRIQRALELTD